MLLIGVLVYLVSIQETFYIPSRFSALIVALYLLASAFLLSLLLYLMRYFNKMGHFFTQLFFGMQELNKGQAFAFQILVSIVLVGSFLADYLYV